MKELTDALV